MKLQPLITSTLAALLLPISQAAFALPNSVWVSTDDVNGYLNIRAAASTQSRIQGRADNGNQLNVVSKMKGADGYDWYQIRAQASSGWVRSDFLSFVAPMTLSTSSAGCEQAIASARKKLSAVPSLTIKDARSKPIGHPNPPRGRAQHYTFGLIGQGGLNALTSPRLTSQLSAQIISNCPSIGQVTFGMWQSDAVATYGLMPGKMIRAFQCSDSGNLRLGIPPEPRWGEFVCL